MKKLILTLATILTLVTGAKADRLNDLFRERDILVERLSHCSGAQFQYLLQVIHGYDLEIARVVDASR